MFKRCHLTLKNEVNITFHMHITFKLLKRKHLSIKTSTTRKIKKQKWIVIIMVLLKHVSTINVFKEKYGKVH